jgi:long-subunit fatty acid transport protein
VYFFKPGTLLTNRANSFDWRDTWKLRLGAERRFGERLSLLGGWSYDRFAVDTASLDFATTVDVPMHRLYTGVRRSWTKSLETTLAGVYGAGSRNERGIEYRLSGFQLMLGARLAY